MPVYKPFICEGPFDTTLQDRVKTFILKVSINQAGSYPDNAPISLLKDGRPKRILNGAYWEMNNKEVFAAHDPGREIPIWVPPILSCISLSWGLGTDPEVQTAIREITCKIAADLFRPLRQSLMQSFGGLELVNLAINDETRELAGEFPADPNDPESRSVWRAPISGLEIPNVTDPESPWNVFPLN